MNLKDLLLKSNINEVSDLLCKSDDDIQELTDDVILEDDPIPGSVHGPTINAIIEAARGERWTDRNQKTIGNGRTAHEFDGGHKIYFDHGFEGSDRDIVEKIADLDKQVKGGFGPVKSRYRDIEGGYKKPPYPAHRTPRDYTDHEFPEEVMEQLISQDIGGRRARSEAEGLEREAEILGRRGFPASKNELRRAASNEMRRDAEFQNTMARTMLENSGIPLYSGRDLDIATYSRRQSLEDTLADKNFDRDVQRINDAYAKRTELVDELKRRGFSF